MRRSAPAFAFVVFLFHSCAHQQGNQKREIRGEIYSNPDFGLSLTVPEPLKIQKGDFLEGAPFDQTFYVFLKAWERPKILSPRKVLVVYANDLSRYPDDQRNPAAYLRKVVRVMTQEGSEVLHEHNAVTVGGIKAVRADFRKGRIYQSVFVVVRKGFALVFTITGSNKAEIDELFQSLNVKFSGEADT